MQDCEGLHDRIARDIRTAKVQKPRYGVGKRQDDSVLTSRGQFRTDPDALCLGGLAGKFAAAGWQPVPSGGAG